MTPKVQETNMKIDRWEYIKLKISCTAKEAINRVKRQPTEWENIFPNHTSDEGLISRIGSQTTQWQENNAIKKWAKDLNRHSYKENRQIANMYMKKGSPSLIIGSTSLIGSAIKTTMNYHLTPVRMAIIKKTKVLVRM